jgi:PST family polysaccharide transporter
VAADGVAADGVAADGGLRVVAVRSFGWAAVSLGGSRLLVFLTTLLLARLLAPADFGLVAAGLVIVTFLEIALDLGVGSSLVYEQETGITSRVHTAFLLNLLVAVTLAGVGMLATPLITDFFHTAGQETLIRVLFGYLVIRGAGQVQDAILKRDLRFRQRAWSELAGGAVRAGVSVALAAAGYGAWAIVWGLLAGELVATAARWVQVGFRPRLRLDLSAARSLMRFGLAITALRVLSTASNNADYVVVGRWLDITALGYYLMSYRLPELIIANAYWVLSTVAFPLYARARRSGPEAFRSAVLRTLRLVTLFGFVAGVGLALLARDAVLVLLSPDWAPAITPMVLISLALGASAVEYASGDVFPAVGRPGLLVRLNIPLALVKLAGFVLAAPYGIVAVAAVHLGFSVVYAVIRLAVANRVVGLRFREDLAAMAPAALAVGGMLALALPVRLLTEPGPAALLLILAAAAAGAIAAVVLGARSTVGEVRDLVRAARNR